MSGKEKIEQVIQDQLSPTFLEVVDESPLHAGHAGAQESGGGHFAVLVVSDAFEGQSAVGRHRAVYAAVRGQFENAIHALVIKAYTPAEWEKVSRA